jgi:hypothetical protein
MCLTIKDEEKKRLSGASIGDEVVLKRFIYLKGVLYFMKN